MLDAFLQVAFSKSKIASARQSMVDNFMKLPEEELKQIVSGEVKLASCFPSDSSGDWLEKFRGSPLYDEALALEQESLQMDIVNQQQQSMESQNRQSHWDARDAVNLRKRVLELKMRTEEHAMMESPEEQAMEAAVGTPATGEVVPPGAMEPPVAQPTAEKKEPAIEMKSEPVKMAEMTAQLRMAKEAVSANWISSAVGNAAKTTGTAPLERFAERMGTKARGATTALAGQKNLLAAGAANKALAPASDLLHKAANVLTQATREEIKPKNFAIPKGNGPGDTGKYPIENSEHASNALARVKQFGSSSEKAKVYAAVAKKYPGLAERSSVSAVKDKVKEASASFAAAVAELKKEAGPWGALATGVGKAFEAGKAGLSPLAAKAGFDVAKAAPGLGTSMKNVAGVGLQWAKKNPLHAAGAIGGAGLAAGAAGHAMLGGGNNQQ